MTFPAASTAATSWWSLAQSNPTKSLNCSWNGTFVSLLSMVGSPRRSRCRPASDRPDTEPSWGGVLLDLCTGATTRAGDLYLSLKGMDKFDRDRTAASNDSPESLTIGSHAAELSTILLRPALNGRSAGLWITSGMVSGSILFRVTGQVKTGQ